MFNSSKILTRVTASNVEDLECGLDVLSHNILKARVALVPIELLLLPITHLISKLIWLLTCCNGLPNILTFRTMP
jgi:hypothetical protein